MKELIIVNADNSGLLTVSSRDVAEHFEKNHKDVLRGIETLQTSAQNCANLFIESVYADTYGRSQKEYLLTRDGFSLVVMGFTGQKTLEWKLKYIEAFNKMEAELNSPERIMARALFLAEKTINQLQLESKVKDQQIAELKPKADYMDRILQSKGTITVSAISKDYGMSAAKFNTLLHDLKIQYKQGDIWLLYQKYQSSGYTHSKTFDYLNRYGMPQTRLQTQWTQKGRLFLYEILKSHGILPMIERESIQNNPEGLFFLCTRL